VGTAGRTDSGGCPGAGAGVDTGEAVVELLGCCSKFGGATTGGGSCGGVSIAMLTGDGVAGGGVPS
jgi:hypothetical protein